MTSSATPPPDDSYWRRPTNDEAAAPGTGHRDRSGAPGQEPRPTPYSGPPRSAPPPYGWRPPQVMQAPPPRPMPSQDHPAVDRQEQAAQTITSGVGLIAGAIMIVLLLVLCGRWLF